MPPIQKQPDMGGEAAWQGGNPAIQRADVVGVLHCFALRRLQCLAKLTSLADPAKLVSMSFEAMLQSIENLAPDEAVHFDHCVLRVLYAKHTGTLTPDQHQ